MEDIEQAPRLQVTGEIEDAVLVPQQPTTVGIDFNKVTTLADVLTILKSMDLRVTPESASPDMQRLLLNYTMPVTEQQVNMIAAKLNKTIRDLHLITGLNEHTLMSTIIGMLMSAKQHNTKSQPDVSNG